MLTSYSYAHELSQNRLAESDPQQSLFSHQYWRAAVGMAVAMLIGLWIYDELSFDTYHRHYDRIAQVLQHQTSNGKTYTGPSGAFSPGERNPDALWEQL